MFRRSTHVLLPPLVAQLIRPLEPEPVIYNSGDSCVHHVPHNDPTLPQLTVAFEVFPRGYYEHTCDLIPPSSADELRRRESILLESKHSITSDTQFVSMTFDHSEYLRTRSNPFELYRCICDYNLDDRRYVTTRTVRVVPTMDRALPRIPTELLIKIFESMDSCDWQRDLLSLAQVCRQWSRYAIRLLFARLEPSEWKNHCPCFPSQYLDPCSYANALRTTPVLGLGVQHLDLDQHNGSQAVCWDHWRQKASPGFSKALVTILRATKNLQHLHLSLGYSTQASALFSALPKLDHLHTLSITHTTCQFPPTPPTKYWLYSISTTRLARCMACWPALTSLTVEHLMAGSIGMARYFLPPPACALTQLCIRDSYISDKDLLYLTASSARTLAQVTLDHVWDITDEGLCVFLASISRNVTSLTIRDADSESGSPRKGQHALDAVVDKMRCLQALNIRGDVGSERMLRRRSEMFLRSRGSGVPVVRLSFEAVPGLCRCKDDEWAGWEVVEVC